MTTLLLATRNRHKVEEIRAILGPGFRCPSLDDVPPAPEVVEDAGTFAGNATKKAVELVRWASHAAISPQPNFVLADDSGLEVDALNGQPGVRSARFAALDTGPAGNSSPAENNAKLLGMLRDVPPPKRTARFRCVIALTPVHARQMEASSPVCFADEAEIQTELFDGTCEGRIGNDLRGHGGFGYDPLFIPNGYDQTFGELPDTLKNQLSHRAHALTELKQHLGLL